MASNEFKTIEEFISGFTKTETEWPSIYDGVIFGMDFEFRGQMYRITRDPIGVEDELKDIFGHDKSCFIKLQKVPKKDYPRIPSRPLSLYLGVYEDVYDLLDNANIEGIPLREILVSKECTVWGID